MVDTGHARTEPTDADRAKADEVLAGAIARWLSDRVQVPEHRAITASFAFLTLPEIVALTSARNEADQLRARVLALAEEWEANGGWDLDYAARLCALTAGDPA